MKTVAKASTQLQASMGPRDWPSRDENPTRRLLDSEDTNKPSSLPLGHVDRNVARPGLPIEAEGSGANPGAVLRTHVNRRQVLKGFLGGAFLLLLDPAPPSIPSPSKLVPFTEAVEEYGEQAALVRSVQTTLVRPEDLWQPVYDRVSMSIRSNVFFSMHEKMRRP